MTATRRTFGLTPGGCWRLVAGLRGIVRSMRQRRREREAGLVDRGPEYPTHLGRIDARDRLSTALNESYA